jgi:hypothetical protein
VYGAGIEGRWAGTAVGHMLQLVQQKVALAQVTWCGSSSSSSRMFTLQA